MTDDWPQIKARLEYESEHAVSKQHRADIRAALQRVEERAEAAEKRVKELERPGSDGLIKWTMRAEAAEAKLARVVEAALDLVGEYESHGGKGTHQTCIPGAGCVLPQKVAALLAAAKGE